MLKKNIKYEDYNGETRSEDFFFHFSEAELAEMSLSYEGGVNAYINRIINTHNTVELAKLFKKLILDAVGERSDDGKRFIKVRPNGVRVADEFYQTEAFSVLYMSLLQDETEAAAFIKECLPKKVQTEVEKLPTKAN